MAPPQFSVMAEHQRFGTVRAATRDEVDQPR